MMVVVVWCVSLCCLSLSVACPRGPFGAPKVCLSVQSHPALVLALFFARESSVVHPVVEAAGPGFLLTGPRQRSLHNAD